MSNLLRNKVFISTRPADQNKELKNLLEKEGAKLLEMPTINIQSNDLTGKEEDMLIHINQFSWIVFTSPNGIRFFFQKLNEITGSYYLPSSIKLASVGKKTSRLLMEYGHEVTIENPGNTSEDLTEELLKAVNEEDSILFPEGDLARGVIADRLSETASCETLVVYKNTIPTHINQNILTQIIKGKYDGIILTSPSGFNNLMTILNNKTETQKLKLICIGSTTASEVTLNGFKPVAIARMSSAEGIVEVILDIYHTTTVKS